MQVLPCRILTPETVNLGAAARASPASLRRRRVGRLPPNLARRRFPPLLFGFPPFLLGFAAFFLHRLASLALRLGGDGRFFLTAKGRNVLINKILQSNSNY